MRDALVKRVLTAFIVLFLTWASALEAQEVPISSPESGAPVPVQEKAVGSVDKEISASEPQTPVESPILLKQSADLSSVEVDQTGSVSGQPSPMPSSEFVRLGWEASSHGDLAKLQDLMESCLSLYGNEARRVAASMQGFPPRDKIQDYQIMNDVSTVMFIRAEALMNYDNKDEAILLFQRIIDEFKWTQAWDPRGWYWSVAEKSQDSICDMTASCPLPPETKPGLKTLPKLFFPGKDQVINYRQYGEFSNVGSKDYVYQITNPKGLSDSAGEGIYPNSSALLKNPGYKKAKEDGRLEGSHWDFVYSDDLESAFYKWGAAPEPWGIRLFYLGIIFEKAKMYHEAIKAYHAAIVHFPRTVGWTYWQTPWYPAQAAIAKIKHIVRIHPELNLKVRWMKIEIDNGFDNDVSNDIIVTYPGVIEQKNWLDFMREQWHLDNSMVKLGKVKKRVGQGRVQLVQYDNGHWQMLVGGRPFVIKGVTYGPTKVGQSPDKKTLGSWMEEDTNNNGLPDGPYDSWVDKNRNNLQDPDEPVTGDFQLLKEMGVNTLREYHQPFKPNKDVLRRMHEQYGFFVVMGDFLGKYTLGSCAKWSEGTDYENPVHQKCMMDSVRKMVMEFKDEPYILLWALGNENNYGIASNADKKPEAYFRFANEVAKMIKSIDPNHPVAICNGDTLYLDKFARNSPDVDIFAANVYRGNYGFGSFWEQVMDATGKPAFITEYGCPAYAKHLTLDEAEEEQAQYHRGNWYDIEGNMAGHSDGVGNALGGIIFEWSDEWWKNYSPWRHDKKSDAIGPFPGGFYYEEWFGLVGQGNGQHSPFLRQLRKSYDVYKEMWNVKK